MSIWNIGVQIEFKFYTFQIFAQFICEEFKDARACTKIYSQIMCTILQFIENGREWEESEWTIETAHNTSININNNVEAPMNMNYSMLFGWTILDNC